jgi:predicted GNAT family N-acyltransferase
MIGPVTRDEIVPLRHLVLRPGLPVETAMYPEDDTPGIFHLAERDPDGTIVACVTFFPEDLDGEPAWRFRGMATRAERRNTGIGGRLLEAGVAEVVQRGGRVIWCNGRTAAEAFYRRHGFTSRGEQFMLPPVESPHYLFVRHLPSA